MGSRWIDSDIAETFVCSDKKLTVCLDGLPKPKVLPTSHVLVENTASVVVFVAQALHDVRGKILVNFDVHRYFLGG
jgi:hypothetical protein